MSYQLRVSRLRHPGDLAQNVHAVGVDNGGTWIRLKGLNARGRCVWSLKKPSPTVEKLPAFLNTNLKRFHEELRYLAVGSRGVWKQTKRRAIKRALRGLAETIVVMSDVEAAWLAAFKSEGIIVISGTGSIAYGRTADGRFARAGGLGPEKGDEGSGYWIGREWRCRKFPSPAGRRERAWRSLRPRGEGTNVVRKIAALTPIVILKARAGNLTARAVIREAQSHLGELVIQLIKTLKLRGKVPLSVSGSVLQNEWFRSGFFNFLRQKGVKFQFIKKIIDQVIAPLALHPLPLWEREVKGP